MRDTLLLLLLLKESVVDSQTTSLNVRYCLIRFFVDCTVTNCNFFYFISFERLSFHWYLFVASFGYTLFVVSSLFFFFIELICHLFYGLKAHYYYDHMFFCDRDDDPFITLSYFFWRVLYSVCLSPLFICTQLILNIL